MSKKTILYIGGFRLPDENSSAIRVLGIARMFNDLGYITKIGGKLKGNTSTYKDIDFWSVEHVGEQKYKQGSQIEPIQAKVKEVGKQDIKAIIAYNYAPIAFYKLYKYCKKEEITLIPDITEWYLIDGKTTISSVLRVLLTNWRISIISPRCQHIIFAVHYMANRFSKNHSLVLPVVSNEKETITPLKFLSKNSPIEFIYAGYPGVNFSKEKVNWCIKAFGKLALEFDNFKYHIVGVDQETLVSYDQELKKDFEAAKGKIIAYGSLPHNETQKIIQESTFILFIRPDNRVSRVGFPSKVKEAFDLGIPVITNDTGDLATYIRQGENGYVVSGFSEEVVYQQLKKILSSPLEEINAIKTACCAKNPFDWKYFQPQVKTFFDNV